MKDGKQQEWQAAGRDADTTGVLISPAPKQRKCAHLRFTVPHSSADPRGERRREGEMNRTKQKSHVWARWQAGSRRKCWIGRAVRCVWEWEGWGLPTQRPAAQQHRNPAETGQGEADVPLMQRVKAGQRGGGIRWGWVVDVFILLLKWVGELRMAFWDRHKKLLSSVFALMGLGAKKRRLEGEWET